MRPILTGLSHAFFALIVLLGSAWAGIAFWVQIKGLAFGVSIGLLVAAACCAIALRWRSRWLSWAVVAVAVLGVGMWYQTITPRQDRTWAVDVSRGLTARVSRNIVTLNNLRDFAWHSADQAEARWIDAQYDLDQLQSVDMLTSVWDSPDIAHLLVSFGFADGKHIVFSVEIRREEGESFNELGGFFRQFELVLIGATERDIVKLRSDYRKETVRLYPLNLSAEQRRTMFMAYVQLAERLEREPAFYNTLTANCTTVVYQLAKALKQDLPMDWRLVLSAHLPEYVSKLGILGDEQLLEGAGKSAIIPVGAQERTGIDDYSKAIRVHRE